MKKLQIHLGRRNGVFLQKQALALTAVEIQMGIIPPSWASGNSSSIPETQTMVTERRRESHNKEQHDGLGFQGSRGCANSDPAIKTYKRQ